MKLLTGLALLASLVSARPAGLPDIRDEPALSYNAVALIQCGDYMGTAFWISPNRIITANHVSRERSCSIGGVPLRLVRSNVMEDVSELTGLESRVYLRVRCTAPRRGAVVFAVGYPMGQVRHTSRLVATASRDDGVGEPIARGMLEYSGRSFPGMSGAPMMDREGRAVSMLNRGRQGPNPATWGRVLEDSFLCRR